MKERCTTSRLKTRYKKEQKRARDEAAHELASQTRKNLHTHVYSRSPYGQCNNGIVCLQLQFKKAFWKQQIRIHVCEEYLGIF